MDNPSAVSEYLYVFKQLKTEGSPWRQRDSVNLPQQKSLQKADNVANG